MRKKWKAGREIKETLTLNVASSGTGLYLFLPKDLREQYEINAGDRVKVQLKQVFKRDWAAEGNEAEKRG